MDKKDIQVSDDRELLDRMMTDMEQADELYRPTNYWRFYEKRFLPELRKKGLADFRRRKYSVLDSFGAVDNVINSNVSLKLRFYGSSRIALIIDRMISNNPFLSFAPYFNPEWVTDYFYRQVRRKFDSIGMDLRECPTSLFGNPKDIIEMEGSPWSLIHLNCCSLVADAARHIKFHESMVFCELGAGMGRNIEILARLFPAATLILIDIAPQLYVSNQYLGAVFRERVVPYRKAVALVREKKASLADSFKGRIVILPAWLMPELVSLKIDLFWNSASFQEMEPEVVKNYLDIVKRMSPEYVYINALPEGNFWGERRPGRGGTRKPVLGGHYRECLEDEYGLVAEYDTDYFLRTGDYKSYIFGKSARDKDRR